jgi:hypothetical protein
MDTRSSGITDTSAAARVSSIREDEVKRAALRTTQVLINARQPVH